MKTGVLFNQGMAAPQPSDYRLSPALNARLVGLLLVVLALLLFATTAAVAVFNLSPDLLILLAVLGLATVFGLGYLLTRRAYVVRLDESGYRVRMIRGVGVSAATWKEVAEAATGTPRDLPAVVLRLHDGRTTTIPMAALAADREEFVRDLQAHLQRGQGLRKL